MSETPQENRNSAERYQAMRQKFDALMGKLQEQFEQRRELSSAKLHDTNNCLIGKTRNLRLFSSNKDELHIWNSDNGTHVVDMRHGEVLFHSNFWLLEEVVQDPMTTGTDPEAILEKILEKEFEV